MGAGLPVCEHLCTAGTSPCLKASLDAMPHKRETGTTSEKGARPCCPFICRFNSSQNNLSKTSRSERETLLSNCYCSTSQVVTELNRGISHLNVSTSHTLYFAPGKNPLVSKGSFLKVKVLTLAKQALPQASFGL